MVLDPGAVAKRAISNKKEKNIFHFLHDIRDHHHFELLKLGMIEFVPNSYGVSVHATNSYTLL